MVNDVLWSIKIKFTIIIMYLTCQLWNKNFNPQSTIQNLLKVALSIDYILIYNWKFQWIIEIFFYKCPSHDCSCQCHYTCNSCFDMEHSIVEYTVPILNRSMSNSILYISSLIVQDAWKLKCMSFRTLLNIRI